MRFPLLVHQRGVLLEGLKIPGAHRFLQRVDDLRAEEVPLAFLAPLVVAARFERLAVDLPVRESVAVAD